MSSSDEFAFLDGPPDLAARQLLGWRFLHALPDGSELSGRIVETEAYDQTDAASHSYRGRTPRTDVMFGPSGHLYVYFTYGMHYCCNVVTGPEDHGSAVLIRAVEPLSARERMAENRGSRFGPDDVRLTNGPAKVCQAFAIDRSCNGVDLRAGAIRLLTPESAPVSRTGIVQTTRVGISQAVDVPWRFYLSDSAYVSRR